jgi:adenine-specific DNA-methyltransferase
MPKLLREPPAPYYAERPSRYSDRLGAWYASWQSPPHRKKLGQYLTPIQVAEFMSKLYAPKIQESLRVLDPGAGLGILSCALCEALIEKNPPMQIVLVAYEIDQALAAYLNKCFSYCRDWLKAHGIGMTFHIHCEDFVLANSHVLQAASHSIPQTNKEYDKFNVIIANPPYFKIPKSDPRSQVTQAVIHGQPNIYALFMALSASLLKPDGELIFLTPRSYSAGPYFRLFRQYFFSKVRPETIHLFQSRREAFQRDEVLQENVILHARQDDDWVNKVDSETVDISTSWGTRDLASSVRRTVQISEIMDWTRPERVLRIPTIQIESDIHRIVNMWTARLETYGMKISTGPIVPFRATNLIELKTHAPSTYAPLLWMRNLTAMQVKWPLRSKNKGQYIVVNEASRNLLLPNSNYVLLRRFSAKEQHRRLTAAPLLASQLASPFLGLENHLNYIYRPGSALTSEEAYGLALLLNSALLDMYFRIHNGNTQVSATEIRNMPLPDLHLIQELGRCALTSTDPIGVTDQLIGEVLNLKQVIV